MLEPKSVGEEIPVLALHKIIQRLCEECLSSLQQHPYLNDISKPVKQVCRNPIRIQSKELQQQAEAVRVNLTQHIAAARMAQVINPLNLLPNGWVRALQAATKRALHPVENLGPKIIV
jgi:microcompartment protein CcmL/EutN